MTSRTKPNYHIAFNLSGKDWSRAADLGIQAARNHGAQSISTLLMNVDNYVAGTLSDLPPGDARATARLTALRELARMCEEATQTLGWKTLPMGVVE